MDETQAREAVVQVLRDVAPDVDTDTISDDADLREDAGLDSIDVLNFAAGLEERTGVDVPERDYPHLVTIGTCIRYLVDR